MGKNKNLKSKQKEQEESLGRRRRFIGEYVGKNFEEWEQKAKKAGLLGGIIEELFYPQDAKKKIIYLRQATQEEGVLEQFVPELIKNLRKWSQEEDGAKKMAKLILKKPWKNLYFYKNFCEQKEEKEKEKDHNTKKSEESRSVTLEGKREELEDQEIKSVSRKSGSISHILKLPLYTYDDLIYTLAKGMKLDILRKLVYKTGDPETIKEFVQNKKELQEIADEYPGPHGEDAPVELLHQPPIIMPPAPKQKNHPPREFNEVASELGLERQATGNEKKIKSELEPMVILDEERHDGEETGKEEEGHDEKGQDDEEAHNDKEEQQKREECNEDEVHHDEESHQELHQTRKSSAELPIHQNMSVEKESNDREKTSAS
jgi:hypothetical protein